MMLPSAHSQSFRTGRATTLDLGSVSRVRRCRQSSTGLRKPFQGTALDTVVHRNAQNAIARQSTFKCQAVVASPPAVTKPGTKPDGKVKTPQPGTDHFIDDKLHHKGPKVLIAGAGIGGLVLAVGLLKRGFDVQVFERNLTAIRGEGKYRGPIQVQHEHLLHTFSKYAAYAKRTAAL